MRGQGLRDGLLQDRDAVLDAVQQSDELRADGLTGISRATVGQAGW
jgi:hypothetical protein